MNFRLFIFFALICALSATNVHFRNNCGGHITVVRTENNQSPTVQAELDPGASSEDSFDGRSMNFKNGYEGKTLAEFTFRGGYDLDYYDISIVDGYDTAMQIESSNGGPTLTCNGPGCSDAYNYPEDDTKTKSAPTGGTFTVVFCP